MKQIVINVEDTAYACVLGVLQLCQQVEVVSTEDLQCPLSDIDECFAKAIKELQDEKEIRNRYDFAFIFMAIREGIISGVEPFLSVQNFIDYLRDINVSSPPCKNSIANICTRTQGEYPYWLYDEVLDAKEELRRRNIVMRFSSVFSRLRRNLGQ
ncbi:MAG: hypothetical protein IJG07_12035 [Prevotella sp.]|nr:hypothetical protein [Prevotella sp.]